MDFVLPLVFVPGLALGSFLGVVAARVPLRRSVVHPGSACMSCEAPIRWYDNVPVLSYALLRGRCRRCGVRIPPRDLAIELATALLLVGCVFAFGLTARAAAAVHAAADPLPVAQRRRRVSWPGGASATASSSVKHSRHSCGGRIFPSGPTWSRPQ